MAKKEYIERNDVLASLDEHFHKTDPSGEEQLGFLKCRRIIREQLAADVVPRSAYDQIRWERDVAMQQLNDAGIPFCGKVDAAEENTDMARKHYSDGIKEFAERLKESAFACDVSFGFGREHCEEAVTVLEIDRLVKEITEETQ